MIKKIILTKYRLPSVSWKTLVPGVRRPFSISRTFMIGGWSSEKPPTGGGKAYRRRTQRSITMTSSPERTATAQLHVAVTSCWHF